MNYSPMNRPKDYFHLLFINMTIILNKITSSNDNSKSLFCRYKLSQRLPKQIL